MLVCMTPPQVDPSAFDGFNDALVSEIKAEMGRRDLSSRALGRLINESSQYVSMRLDGGNPRTGKRVPISVADLAAIASAMELDAGLLLERAVAANGSFSKVTPIHRTPEVSEAEDNIEDLYDEPSAAEPQRKDVEGDVDPDLQ